MQAKPKSLRQKTKKSAPGYCANVFHSTAWKPCNSKVPSLVKHVRDLSREVRGRRLQGLTKVLHPALGLFTRSEAKHSNVGHHIGAIKALLNSNVHHRRHDAICYNNSVDGHLVQMI